MDAHVPPMNESDLLQACNTLEGLPAGEKLVSQQLVNQILTNKISRSVITPILAEVLGVRAVWLQLGLGAMRPTAPNGRGPMNYRDTADKIFMEALRELPREWGFMIRSMVLTLSVSRRESHEQFIQAAEAATEQMMKETEHEKQR